MPIQARKHDDGTPGSTTTPELPVRTIEREAAREETRAISRMAYSNVGCIRRGIGLSRAKTGLGVGEEFVSLLILQSN